MVFRSQITPHIRKGYLNSVQVTDDLTFAAFPEAHTLFRGIGEMHAMLKRADSVDVQL